MIGAKKLINLNRMRCFSQFIKLKYNNFFNVFDLKNEFSINQERLANKFKSMQMLYHPDKTAKLDQELKEIADFNSSLINHAYQTLKDPYKRGLHLLNLHNFNISEDESTKNLSNEFLAEIMEINERINDIRDSNDELKKMFDEINMEKNKLLLMIEQNFKEDDYLEAKTHLIKFNFYDNVTRKIVNLMD